MFLGIEGLRGLGKTGFSIEGEKHDVPETIGVKVNMHYQVEDGKTIAYIETNIHESIWNDPENSLLRQRVLRSMITKGIPIGVGVNKENKHIAFRSHELAHSMPQPTKTSNGI